MDIVKPLYTLLLTFALSITIAACSDGDSSTDESASAETTVTTESGVTVSFDTNEVTVDEIFELFYDLGSDELTGTIRWGDNTETRVRGSGNVRHIYRGDGEVSISIQVDGGESELVGIIYVYSAESEQSASSVQSPSSTTAVTYSIDAGSFNFFEVNNGQTQFDASELTGQVSASNGVIPNGAAIILNVTLNPSGATSSFQSIVVQPNGSFQYSFGDQQFIASGNTSVSGTFSFVDQATYGSDTFSTTDNDLNP